MKLNFYSNFQNNFSTQVIIKVTKCFDWHIEGEIIERNAKPTHVDESYVEKMKSDLEQEKQTIKKNKEEKLVKIKAKKQEIAKKMQKEISKVETEALKTE